VEVERGVPRDGVRWGDRSSDRLPVVDPHLHPIDLRTGPYAYRSGDWDPVDRVGRRVAHLFDRRDWTVGRPLDLTGLVDGRGCCRADPGQVRNVDTAAEQDRCEEQTDQQPPPAAWHRVRWITRSHIIWKRYVEEIVNRCRTGMSSPFGPG